MPRHCKDPHCDVCDPDLSMKESLMMSIVQGGQMIEPGAIRNYDQEVPLTVERDGKMVEIGTARMDENGSATVDVTDERMKRLLGTELDRLSMSIKEDPNL